MDPKSVVRKFWSDYAGGDLDTTWAQNVSPALVLHPPIGFDLDRESWLAAEKQLIVAFDDVRTEVLDQVADGNKVATRWSISGVQKHEFYGIPATGRTGTLFGTSFDVVEDGKIVEHWAEVGVAAFLQQLSATA